MKIRCFEENDIKPIYELLKNELGYEVDYSLFVLRVQEMIKNNYLIYVACIENKVVGFIGIEVSYVFELPKQIMRVNALAIDKNYQNKGIGKQLIQKVEKLHQEEIELEILRSLGKVTNQRTIADEIGYSAGKVNYVLKKLVEKGLVKVDRFVNSKSKVQYKYLLTPEGIKEKIAITEKFIQIKKEE